MQDAEESRCGADARSVPTKPLPPVLKVRTGAAVFPADLTWGRSGRRTWRRQSPSWHLGGRGPGGGLPFGAGEPLVTVGVLASARSSQRHQVRWLTDLRDEHIQRHGRGLCAATDRPPLSPRHGGWYRHGRLGDLVQPAPGPPQPIRAEASLCRWPTQGSARTSQSPAARGPEAAEARTPRPHPRLLPRVQCVSALSLPKPFTQQVLPGHLLCPSGGRI